MTTRDVDELLKLDSYQDMSDEEISLLIDYKERIARMQATASALNDDNDKAVQAFKAATDDARAAAQAAFKTAVEYTPDFKGVNANG